MTIPTAKVIIPTVILSSVAVLGTAIAAFVFALNSGKVPEETSTDVVSEQVETNATTLSATTSKPKTYTVNRQELEYLLSPVLPPEGKKIESEIKQRIDKLEKTYNDLVAKRITISDAKRIAREDDDNFDAMVKKIKRLVWGYKKYDPNYLLQYINARIKLDDELNLPAMRSISLSPLSASSKSDTSWDKMNKENKEISHRIKELQQRSNDSSYLFMPREKREMYRKLISIFDKGLEKRKIIELSIYYNKTTAKQFVKDLEMGSVEILKIIDDKNSLSCFTTAEKEEYFALAMDAVMLMHDASSLIKNRLAQSL